MNKLEVLRYTHIEQWCTWLTEHGATSKGVILALARSKKAPPEDKITYDDALDEALCNGWIDSGGHKPKDGADPAATYTRFSPRRAKSSFSTRNAGFVERLIREGRMRPAGLSAVEVAKANGTFGVPYNRALAKKVSDRARNKAKAEAQKPLDDGGDGSKATPEAPPTRTTRSGRVVPSYTAKA